MISVLTLVKNREAHLRNLVEGLRRSDMAPAELVIVDMSDTPVAHPAADFQIRLIRLATEGLPLAEARNLAASHASSPFLLFLDVDCIPGPGLVSAMADALDQRDALICAEIRYLTAGDANEGQWSDASLSAAGVSHPARRFPPSGVAGQRNFGLFWSLAFGVSASAFKRIGGLDEAFTGYGAEDTDFAFRARETGIDLLFLGGTCAYHQHHGVFDPPLQHFDDIVRNARVFHARWGKWPMLGWLDAFADRGLLIRNDDQLEITRQPTVEDIRQAERPRSQPF
ncbi:glycosyltransferase family 2 protein [Bosea sp. BH3]|uniref:glycosyltransferase family 2 protein n=1 Tax=Bosea sp. BH3 TaxID=2871701 RepID=UPI0021CB5799|nr:glycosyltransferase [Bosea sp. BH3]